MSQYVHFMHFVQRTASRPKDSVLTLKYPVYHLFQYTNSPHSAHRVYLCVPYGSHNKQH
jgi:hypothetical protein